MSRTRMSEQRIGYRVTVALVALAAGCRASAPPVADRRPEPVAPRMEPVPAGGIPAGGIPAGAPQVTSNRVVAQTPASPGDASRDLLRATADSAAGAPMWRNARWGILVVDAASGDTLYSRDADHLFMPASNQKLLTAAVALQHLGEDYRWRTPVLLRGKQSGSTWQGDLLIEGTGDPSFSDSLRAGDALNAFDPIAQALASRGIRRITGTVRPHGDRMPGITTGFGWEIDDLASSYGAPVDELLLNEGELVVRVRAGTEPGAPVSVSTHPTIAYPSVDVTAVTRAGDAAGERLRVEYDSVGGTLLVTGSLAAGDSVTESLAYRHPSDAVLHAVMQRLGSAGITIDGALGDARAVVPDGMRLDTLVVLESATMADVIRRMQKPSQNQIAEMLFRTAGFEASGAATADSARALAARTLAQWGVAASDMAYRDGSGMSRHDYVTPRALVRVLDAMHRSPWASTYRSALPVAGVDGTLRNRMRGTSAAGNAQAKTGSLDKARSLSGYVTSADGRLLLFSMLANNFSVPTREVERVQDLLVSLLASGRFGGGASATSK